MGWPNYSRMPRGARAVADALDQSVGRDPNVRMGSLAIAVAKELQHFDAGVDQRNLERFASLVEGALRKDRDLEKVGAIFAPAAGHG